MNLRNFLLAGLGLLALCGCKDSKAGQAGSSIKSEWQKKFHAALDSEIVPTESHNEYADKICQELISPQWKPASNVDQAISQIKSLMGSINAEFELQKDVGVGWVVYYYDMAADGQGDFLVPSVEGLYGQYLPLKYQEYSQEATHLHNEFGFSGGIQMSYLGFIWPSIFRKEGNVVGFMNPIIGTDNLDKYWNSKELQQPPKFMFPLIVESYKGLNRTEPDPDQWKYLFSERRDSFAYLYKIQLEPPVMLMLYGLKPSLADKFSIYLGFHAKRNQDGSLTDIQLDNINCGFQSKDIPVDHKLLEPFIGKEFDPEPPVIVKPCVEHQTWLHCYGHSFSERYRATHRDCQKITSEEPVCNLESRP
jgi:hypothetical protein